MLARTDSNARGFRSSGVAPSPTKWHPAIQRLSRTTQLQWAAETMGFFDRHRRDLIILGVAGAAIAGIAALAFRRGFTLAPGSRDYQPVSKREAAAFGKANRKVFPADVRQNPDAFKATMIAWAGIIRAITVTEEQGEAVFRFDVEHRYFDWIEDNSPRLARYLLAPRGEGNFRAPWSVDLSVSDKVKKEIVVGDMLVVYGCPSEIRDQTIGIYPTEYARHIKAVLYDDKVLDYGR